MYPIKDMDIAPVWDEIHRTYIAEHASRTLDLISDLEAHFERYIATGDKYHWREVQNLLRVMEERMTAGSLARIAELAYFVCEQCDSDICDHAIRYN